MRKLIIFLILFLFGINIYGQFDCDYEIDSVSYYHTINSDTFKGILDDGKKISGHVSQFKILHCSQKLELMVRPGEEKLHRNFVIKQEDFYGEYLDGKKVGKWKNVSHQNSIKVSDYTVYKTDTIVFTLGLPLSGREYCYTRDSSVVHGEINKYCHPEIADGMTIEFKCKKSNGCKYMIPGQLIFEESDLKDLEKVLFSIELGLYNRKIREMRE